MKRIIPFLLVYTLATGLTFAQKMTDLYKNGPVKLIAEKYYGSENDWDKLFNLYYDTASHRTYISGNLNKYVEVKNGPEDEKRIIVAPDGSLFMSHRNRHEIWKFSPDGNFQMKFGSRGGKPEQFSKMPLIYPVADNKYLIVCGDVDGKIKFFDLEGHFYKSISRNFPIGSFQPLGNSEVLYKCAVMIREKVQGSDYFTLNSKHLLVKLNIITGDEQRIFSIMEPGDLMFPASGNLPSQMVPPPNGKTYLPNYYLFKRPVFTLMENGFLMSNRETGEVRRFDLTGKELSKFVLDINPLELSDQDIENHYLRSKSMLEDLLARAKAMPDLPEKKVQGNNVKKSASYPDKKEMIARAEKGLSMIERLKDRNGYFPHLPFFSNIIMDSQGNMLVFEFTRTEEKESNVFNVVAYDKDGKSIARTSFLCDDYEINFTGTSFVIKDGYVYTIARLRNSSGMPLRLVKFKMTN